MKHSNEGDGLYSRLAPEDHPGVKHAKVVYQQRDLLEEWQINTDKTAVYPDSFNKDLAGAVYLTLGLNGEAGEVAEEIKKIIRNDDGIITPERRAKLKLEIGDVGWYWLRLISELGFTLDEVMKANIEKLTKRYEHR